jgi:type II secretory pathway component GspD/PulD (secretin)
MANVLRGGLIAPLFLLLAGLFSAGLFAQDAEPEEFNPDPEQPITIDFVQKDLHTVMHYIALRSGLQIIVEGEVDVKLTVMFRKVIPKQAIQSICKANKLDYIEDGIVIIIKQRPQDLSLAHVVRGETEPQPGQPDRYNVSFESHELVAAIMEVATVTKTQVFVPAVQQPEAASPPPRSEDEQAETERVLDIQARKISIHMREALPARILERLAQLGDLEFETITLEDAVEGATTGYKFKYRAIRTNQGIIDPSGGGEPILSEDWTIPGANMSTLKTELRDLLSPYGSIVVDDTIDYLVVFDTEKKLEDFRKFLDPLEVKSMELAAASAELADDLVVRTFSLHRDVTQQTLLTSLQATLSADGRIVANADDNSIIIYERESRMANIETIMASLDMEPEQVLLTAKLIEVGLDEYMGYGLELFTSHSADNLNDGRFTGSSQDTASGTVGGLFGQPTGFDPFFATFTNPRIDVRLELLANEGRVKTLSQPTQMVSNRKQARIEVGQEIPYLESSSAGGGTTTASVSFKEVSIVMQVTPTILEDGLIRLEVTVTVREVIGNVAIEGNNTPVLSKRESRTDVFVRDGETLVMGGLMRERERTDENGLPFLKDIPFLGYLFKSANRTVNKTDLLFFLRPQIVNANGPKIEMVGQGIERDLRPLIYEDDDAKKAGIRPGRFRKLETRTKPAWYNDSARPKTAKDVKPGA